MTKATIALAIAAVSVAGALAAPDDATPLQPGEYQVAVRLELPHIKETSSATAMASICVKAGEAGTRGLAALDDRNPLRNCPASNVRQDGETLSFDIVCPGGDAAVGSARYTMRAEQFDGAITVKMGGKNMTMIERQSGRRMGRCK
jgi:hypothetical protein